MKATSGNDTGFTPERRGMRIPRLAWLGLATWLWSAQAFAETYYIDWDHGDDTHAGTSQAQAWKRHPFMHGFAGTTYVHRPGDRFIFRGGVTWPNEALQLKVTASGDSDSNRDYYGVDHAWYAGDSWSRPVFDAEGRAIAGQQIVIELSNQSFITVEGIEIRNQYIDGGMHWLHCGITAAYARSITVRDVHIHDWIMDRTTDENVGGVCGWGNDSTFVLEHSDIGPGGPTGPGGASGRANGGMAARNVSIIRYNKLHGNPNTIVGGGFEVVGNEIYDVTDSFDSAAHENALEVFYPALVHDNIIHDVAVGVNIFVGPISAEAGGNTFVYNNITYSTGPVSLSVDCRQTPTNETNIFVFNNVFEHGEWATIGTYGDHCNLLDLRNNVYITDITWTTPVCYNNPSCGTFARVNDVANVRLTHAEAAAAGLTVASRFRPGSASSPTVDHGVSLDDVIARFHGLPGATQDIRGIARPQRGAWDLGAYEYTEEPDPTTVDAGGPADAGGRVVADGGIVVVPDGGGASPGQAEGGCSCRIGAARSSGTSLAPLSVLALSVGVATLLRRRRKNTRSNGN